MFSKLTNQGFGFKSVASMAIMVSCALGMTTAQDIFNEEPFEQIVADRLTELARLHNSAQCSSVRDKQTTPPSDSYPNMSSILHGYNVFKGSPYA